MGNLLALANGTELVGDYQIRRVLGAGGFGITYLADEISLSRLVTIKEYFPSDFAARKGAQEAAPRSQDCAADYKWGLDRFIEEAQTLARFEHPNIVRVFRYFRANNTGYMVLQWEEGKSLKNWLKDLGRAPRQAELDQIVAPLLDALELIHKRDFLHRDIAPDNIIIRTDKSPVLIDFGSARGEIASHSRTVSALVKPGYSPYEQYATTTSQQGAWTDIYALGATLYQAVTGKRPPDAPSRVVQDEYVPARDAAVGSFRPGFLAAIDKALTIEPGQRPQSVLEWRGPLLAPPEKPAKARGGLGLGLKKQRETAEAPAVVAAAPTAVTPPPPDAPQPKGQFVDFVEGLRKAPPEPKGKAKAKAEPAAANAAPADLKTRLAEVAPANADQNARYGLGYGPAPGTAKAAAPVKAEAAAAKKADKTPAANKTPAAMRGAPEPAPQAPHAPVARPIRKTRTPLWKQALFFLRPPWRGILFKLGVGAGVASLAVAYQNHQFPAPEPQPAKAAAKTASSGAIVKPASVVTGSTSTGTEPAILPTQPSLQLVKQKTSVTAMSVLHTQRRIATLAADGTINLSDVDNGSLARSYSLVATAPSVAIPAIPASSPSGPIVSAAMTGSSLVVAGDGGIAVWDTLRGERIASGKPANGDIKAVAWLGGGEKIAASSSDGHLAIFAKDTLAQLQRSTDSHNDNVTAMVGIPGRNIVASASTDKTVKVWNSETLSLVRTYRGHNGPVGALDAASDGRMIASGAEDGQVRLWSTASTRLIRTLRGHTARITAVAFAPNAELLATSAKDGSIRLWDVRRGRTAHALPANPSPPVTLAFIDEGKRLAVAGEDGSVKIWDISAIKLARD